MRKKIKYGLTFSALVCGLVFLSGCGNGNGQPVVPSVPQTVAPNSGTINNNTPDTSAPAEDSSSLPAPPAPTGKVDDAVNAIEQGANVESTQATNDTGDAQAATDNSSNSQTVNDIGAGL